MNSTENHSLKSAEPTNPRRGVGLSRLGELLWPGLIVAVGLAALIVSHGPFRDPIDVIGPPLMSGYSEANEHWACYLFATALVVTTTFACRVIRPSQTSGRQVFGLMLCLLLVVLPFGIRFPLLAFGLAVLSALTFGLGRFVFPQGDLSDGNGRVSGRCGMILFVCGCPVLRELVVASWLAFVVVVVGVVLVEISPVWRERPNRLRIFHRVFFATLVVGGWMLESPMLGNWLLAGLGASGLLLGRHSCPRGRESSFWRGRLDSSWLLILCAIAGFEFWFGLSLSRDRLPYILGGAGAVLLLERSLTHSGITALRTWGTDRRLLLLSLGVLFLMFASRSLTVALLMSLVLAMAIWSWPPRWRPIIHGGLLPLSLGLALWPAIPKNPFDHFHDGYNLSCAWMFEQNRTLYADLLPIRGFDFFMTWLSRLCWPKTIAAYLEFRRALGMLTVIGCAMLGWSWTRSAAWGLALGLLPAAWGYLDGRQGILFCLATVVVVSFDHVAWRSRIGFLSAGTLAALCGFDALVSIVVSASGALFLATPWPDRGSAWRWFVRATARATGLALLMLLPFCGLIGLWQGPEAIIEFWRVFFDFSRYFQAFSGKPIEWWKSPIRSTVLGTVLPWGVWIIAGTVVWRTLNQSRRTRLSFLVLFAMFLLHRGLGRSDAEHWHDLILLSQTLLALGLWELWPRSRRSHSPRNITREQLGCVCAAGLLLLVWRMILIIPNIDAPPWIAGRDLASEETMDRGADEFVLRTVAPHEIIWCWEQTAAYYAHERSSATRHALAHILCSPHEQTLALAALQARPPRLIAWPQNDRILRPEQINSVTFGSTDVIHSLDEIALPLRYHRLMPWLFSHFRPADSAGWLEPVPAGWPGFGELPERVDRELPIGRIALIWGEHRWPKLREQVNRSEPLMAAQQTPWRCDQIVTPRDWNYLTLQLECNSPDNDRTKLHEISLEFGDDHNTTWSRITFLVRADGVTRTYLLPIGSSPAWGWRQQVSRLRLAAPDLSLARTIAELHSVAE